MIKKINNNLIYNIINVAVAIYRFNSYTYDDLGRIVSEDGYILENWWED